MTAALVVLGACGAVSLPLHRRLSGGLAALQIGSTIVLLIAHGLGLPKTLGVPLAWWSSPITGGVLLASGVANACLAARHLAFGQVVALVVLLFSLLLGLGHVFPHGDLYRYVPGTGVAIPTVTAFVLLSLCQLLVCRHRGVVGALTSGSLAGHTGLRLLFGGCIGVLLWSGVVLMARHRHGFDVDTAVLLAAWGAMAVLVGTLWALAVSVDKADAARWRAERQRDEVRQWVAAAVTHDLRSPLMAASMSTVLLRRQVDQPKALAAIDRMERSHRRMDRLLRTLMDALAADGSDTPTLRPVACQLGALVDEVVQEHESMLAARVGRVGDAAGRWDRDALARVIENLLLNAVKYGTPGTPIGCRIDTPGDGGATLTIENLGPAIAHAEWETIFQPFARGRHTAEPQIGWGVGLAYARSVAAAQGGSLQVTASDGERTAFTLRLPENLPGAAGQ